MKDPVAHVRKTDTGEYQIQTVYNHLKNVSYIAGRAGAKLGFKHLAELAGLLHDLGKYSQAFQTYIREMSGLDPMPPSGPTYAPGTVDHSTAGAQHIRKMSLGLHADIISMAAAAHHSGLLNSQPLSGGSKSSLEKRLGKSLHPYEVPFRVRQMAKLLNLPAEKEVLEYLKRSGRENAEYDYQMLVRYIFSCVVDGDRCDTAGYETFGARPRSVREIPRNSCGVLAERLDKHVRGFGTPVGVVNEWRAKLSVSCRNKADGDRGIRSLTAPTGSGKTLASMRFGLHHARKHKMEGIVVVLPYTSIIEQNANEIRKILDVGDSMNVLEHHSNLDLFKGDGELTRDEAWDKERKTRLLAENWDAPVVFMTSVRFLETILAAHAGSARHLHGLANRVIIMDEVQALPYPYMKSCLKFLDWAVRQAGCSVVLSTATHPSYSHKSLGSAGTTPCQELADDVEELFRALKRTSIDVSNASTPTSTADAADRVLALATAHGSCLCILNTKKAAREVYEALSGRHPNVMHLSTSMCPKHRLAKIKKVRKHLEKGDPLILVSTQLIEAGVDVDFASVVRATAGLDSILQAAGRCNRHGKRPGLGPVEVWDIIDHARCVVEISQAMDSAAPVLGAVRGGTFGADSAEALAAYFDNRMTRTSLDLDVSLDGGGTFQLVPLLKTRIEKADRTHPGVRVPFSDIGDLRVISQPTTPIVVPYGTGKTLWARVEAVPEEKVPKWMLVMAQRFSVQVWPNTLDKLSLAGALQESHGILFLDNGYYDDELGLVDDGTTPPSPGAIII